MRYNPLVSDSMDMTGTVVLGTGGGKGLGRGIAETFLAHGADVMICGRTEVTDLPSAEGRTAVFTSADVREVSAVTDLLQTTMARFGRLEVVIDNAGGTPPAFVAGPPRCGGRVPVPRLRPGLEHHGANLLVHGGGEPVGTLPAKPEQGAEASPVTHVPR